MTKPNTVPNTVNSWFEAFRLWEVNLLTEETTAERCKRSSRVGVRPYSSL